MTRDTPRRGRAAFRFPDYRNYVASRFLWTLAQQCMGVATAWFVYERTQDVFALGLIGLATFLPSVPLSLVTGAVADRHDRRRIIMICCTVMGGCAAFVYFLTSTDWILPVYAAVMVMGGARSFVNPAGQALMMNLIPDEEYTSATSWNNSITQTASVLGPGVGGLLYPLGAGVPFAVSFVLYVLAVLLAWRISSKTGGKGARAPVTLAILVAGYRYIWSRQVLLGSITLDLVAVLLGGATAMLPVYAQEIFLAGPWALGLLRSTPSMGSILAALVFANFPVRRNVGRTMYLCVFIYGLATIGFGLSTNMFVAMIFLFIIGAADMVSVVIRQSLIQIETPNEMRGRVIAVHTILTGTSNQLGDFESGTLAKFIGAVSTVVFGGCAAVATTALWIRLFPELFHRDQFEPPKAGSPETGL